MRCIRTRDDPYFTLPSHVVHAEYGKPRVIDVRCEAVWLI